MNIAVSILIVNYNTSQLLLDCISSVCREVKGITYEIIVADNCSNEEQKALLRGDDRFRLIELVENLGFGRANNEAAKCAKGECLFLLNPDTILLNDAVTILYQYLKKHPQTGICGGNLYDGNMMPTHSFHRLFPSFLSEFDFATGQIYRRLRYGRNSQFNHTSRPLSVAMITGADIMISRQLWDDIGGFLDDYFMYCEDADLCLSCQQYGRDVVSVPDARIQHFEGRSFVESESHCRRVLDGRFTFFRKHHGKLYNSLTDCMNILSLCFAVIVSKCCGRKTSAANYSQRLRLYMQIVLEN